MASPVQPPKDYYDIIHRPTWARRTAGLFAAGIMGAAFGGVMGVVAAFLPCALAAIGVAGASAAALPGIAAIASSAALFAGVLAGIGMVIGADVGANSGSIAAGLAEKEKREASNDPSKSVSGPASEAGPSSPYLWKAAPFLIPMFAAFGALTALNPLTASAITSLSFPGGAFAAQSVASVVASSVLFGVGGSLMAFRSSKFTNQLSNFFMDVFDGKVFDRMTFGVFKSKEPAVAAEAEKPAAIVPEALMNDIEPAKQFATGRVRFSLQGLIEKTDAQVEQSTLMR